MSDQATCPTGHPIDPSWDVCPYCRLKLSDGVLKSPIPSYAGVGKTVGGIQPPKERVVKPIAGWLICLEGTQTGEDFRVRDGRNVIGTAADCDIVVFDHYASPRHAVIVVRHEEASMWLQDLESRNGTFVQDKRITKHQLVDGDEIRLAATRLRFKSAF